MKFNTDDSLRVSIAKQLGRIVGHRIESLIIRNPRMSLADARKIYTRGCRLNREVKRVFEALVRDSYPQAKTADDGELHSFEGYYSGYRPKSLHDQIKKLRQVFPRLGGTNQKLYLLAKDGGLDYLPRGAEGWFAIPNIWKPGSLPLIGTTYQDFTWKVIRTLDVISEGSDKNSTPCDPLRQEVSTMRFLEELSKKQGNPEILILPCQFGMRHLGYSVNDVRAETRKNSHECGLGVFASMCMLMTHPKRLKSGRDISFNCPGDTWYDRGRKEVVYFRFVLERIKPEGAYTEDENPNCGSVTAFDFDFTR